MNNLGPDIKYWYDVLVIMLLLKLDTKNYFLITFAIHFIYSFLLRTVVDCETYFDVMKVMKWTYRIFFSLWHSADCYLVEFISDRTCFTCTQNRFIFSRCRYNATQHDNNISYSSSATEEALHKSEFVFAKRPTPRTNARAMGCLLWGFSRN